MVIRFIEQGILSQMIKFLLELYSATVAVVILAYFAIGEKD